MVDNTTKPAMRIDPDKYKYARTKVRDAAGKVRHSATNGDAIAKAMLGLTHDQVMEAMEANGLGDRYRAYAKGPEAKNPGQFRMMVGNTLRGMVRKGTPVTIGAHTVSSLDQDVPVPEMPELVKLEKQLDLDDAKAAKAAGKPAKAAKTEAAPKARRAKK